MPVMLAAHIQTEVTLLNLYENSHKFVQFYGNA